jgi:hypothetical protein
MDGINQFYPKCESRVWPTNTPQDGRSFYFSCGGVVQILPPLNLFSNNLISGTTVNITISVYSELTYNQLYQPIPSEIVFTAESTP